MSAPLPPGRSPDEADMAAISLVASQLGMALPAECVPGVRDNLAVLAGHWAGLRDFADPDA